MNFEYDPEGDLLLERMPPSSHHMYLPAKRLWSRITLAETANLCNRSSDQKKSANLKNSSTLNLSATPTMPCTQDAKRT
jgi:hypothetical protein